MDLDCGYPKRNGVMSVPWEKEVYSVTTLAFDSEIAPTNMDCWFTDFQYMTDIQGLERLDTSHVTNMSGLFDGCYSLTKLDLSHFDTGSVTDMS